jgi:hypothetical protein
MTSATFSLFVLVCARPGRSEPSAAEVRTQRDRAAVEYDRGVGAFDRGDYVLAAQAFLAADALVANDDALTNAIVAARRAHSQTLLEAAGQRGLEREGQDPHLGALARAALAEAAAMTNPPAETTPTSPSRTPTPELSAPAVSTPTPAPERHESARSWSPAIFYVGVGATVVLTGLTIWSGVDTLNAAHRLPGPAGANEEVVAKEHRSNALFAATLVTAGATAFVGLRLVAWNPRTEVATSFGPRSAAFTLRGVW